MPTNESKDFESYKDACKYIVLSLKEFLEKEIGISAQILETGIWIERTEGMGVQIDFFNEIRDNVIDNGWVINGEWVAE